MLNLGIIKSELCRLKLVSDFWKVLPHWKWHFQNFMSLKGNKTVTKNMYITVDYFTYINGNILITNIFVTSRNNVICHCFYKVFTKKRKKQVSLGNASKYRHRVIPMPINWAPIFSDSVEGRTRFYRHRMKRNRQRVSSLYRAN